MYTLILCIILDLWSYIYGCLGMNVDRKVWKKYICLPVRGSERLAWKYDDDCCRCRQVETEEHVLFECKRYGEERG